MEYNFRAIEARWQAYWREQNVYQVSEDQSRPPYYVLDMFPYPSGAGLHVGHPLGYIASDIFARYKRLRGFNVLHPMGYDAFGLPAEQYAIQTGQHPEITTEENIRRYREQLDRIGFSFDWSREVRTSDPEYYRWTQWVFIRLFHSYYNYGVGQARPITELIKHLETRGTEGLEVAESEALSFTAQEWLSWDRVRQAQVLMNYRLAYLGETMVNWCEALGTVLANDEVSDGVSIRGGHPVEQRKMRQWCLRVSAYAGRLLEGLDRIAWSESLKEAQRNWIGRSEGAEVRFPILRDWTSKGDYRGELTVFTTRIDTIYGVTFMVLAPEGDYVAEVTTAEQATAVEEYLQATRRRTERDRMADRRISGVFSGSYAENPITGEAIPIWISDYVLAGYGTGAIMAVPAHDSRDFAFARHFDLPIIQVVLPEGEELSDPSSWTESKDSKSGTLVHSGLLNGLSVQEAIAKMKAYISEHQLGRVRTNYRLRDAIFSRQRYWGEPFPIYYDSEGIAHTLRDEELPLCLPEVDKYLPTSDGQPPLGRAQGWHTAQGDPYELSTMPGFAGSSAYYLRYMDPHNDQALVSKEKDAYWRHVDLYVGGAEHATGHLIYSRFWNKFLFDLGLIVEDEPFQKLINQGMIQGRSNFVYRIKDTNTFVSLGLKDAYDTTPIHVDVNIVSNDYLDLDAFRAWRPEYATADFILEDGRYLCGWAVEKMSKSMYNVVNPDMIVERYGADTLRLYEMFLGPIEQSKPWDTNGIDGVHRFLRKFWGLYYAPEGLRVSDTPASKEELKSLHKLIKKVTQDIEQFSFNTSVAAFMICINELQSLKTTTREVLQPLLILLAPFAPHISEELWHALGEQTTIVGATWPEYDESYLIEDQVKYPVSFNGKTRFTIEIPSGATKEQAEALVLQSQEAQRWLEGKTPKKVIVVPGRIINIVL
ncbi:leucine--tRNA ligase [uncultured Porphyromonas sp.]|uniref:leucine--tRNA ligase n=1 Tax=uncultured Porphyromonas sp. TaxID=159274 RepID=UPI00260812B4|nr:leucine--tRNA ligase [uncultured Porphyromonas sp.]